MRTRNFRIAIICAVLLLAALAGVATAAAPHPTDFLKPDYRYRLWENGDGIIYHNGERIATFCLEGWGCATEGLGNLYLPIVSD